MITKSAANPTLAEQIAAGATRRIMVSFPQATNLAVTVEAGPSELRRHFGIAHVHATFDMPQGSKFSLTGWKKVEQGREGSVTAKNFHWEARQLAPHQVGAYAALS